MMNCHLQDFKTIIIIKIASKADQTNQDVIYHKCFLRKKNKMKKRKLQITKRNYNREIKNIMYKPSQWSAEMLLEGWMLRDRF